MCLIIIVGYLTLNDLREQAKHLRNAFPEIDATKLEEQHQHAWKHMYNAGKEVPEGEIAYCYIEWIF